MKDKKNPLEKFLDRTIVFTFKQLGGLFIVCLGLGALIAFMSFEVGAILIALMFLLVIYRILFLVATLKEGSSE